jgi:chemotaxis protein methyltransferase CheR
VKYFKQAGDRWQIDAGLRDQVRYRPFNLLEDMGALGQFDVIFCRNVLIYFDQPTKQNVLERMARQLAPDGFLYLGGAETVVGITDKFQPMANHRGMYHHANSAAAAKVAAL